MKSRSAGRKACVYCGADDASERDHVPPRGMFLRPHPTNLITVPSCRRCNLGFSKDDEYFRAMMLMRREIAADAKTQPLLATLWRSLKRPQARGLAKRLVESVRDFEVWSSGGSFLGTAPGYTVDQTRIATVLTRITRALYYDETGERLPPEVRVSIDLGFESNRARYDQARRYLAGRPIRAVGRREFQYVWVRATENKFVSLWLLLFYGRTAFLSLTVPPDRAFGAAAPAG